MIARKGQVVHFEQVGQMDIESRIPMADDTIFRIYSMTKPIICVAFMTLYEQGLCHLFDPVAKFLPAFQHVKVLERDAAGNSKEVDVVRPITICDLLTHTSGLTYDFLEDYPVSELYRQAKLLNNAERTLEEFVGELVRLPLAFQPGTEWHYSFAIDVVAHLIEVISGQSLMQFLGDTIWMPLGMIDTNFSVPPEKDTRIATMYGLPDIGAPHMTLSTLTDAWNSGFNERIDVSATCPQSKPERFARGGHGLFSTAWDYLRFAQMLLNGGTLDGVQIVGRKIIELMHMNHLSSDLLPFKVADPPAYGYGFGLGSRVLLNVAESQMPGSVGEYGWAGAAKTYYWVDPKEEMVGILMSQSMMQFDAPEKDFQVLTYQALVDEG
jgi:CubicO group peptidase (beta-lactamase class C family)